PVHPALLTPLLATTHRIHSLATREGSRHRSSLKANLTCKTFCFFFNDTATTEIYTLSLHDALPIFASMTQKLTLSDISDESKNYLDKAGITTACLRIKSKWTAGGK